MSPMFGKRNLRQVFEKYINSNDFQGALSEAVRLGDEFYDLQGLDSAIEVYSTLLLLLEERKTYPPLVFEKAYEKLAGLYFEKQDTKKALEVTFALVKVKASLKKIGEAVKILNVIEKQYSFDRSVLSKILEFYMSFNHLSDALRVVDRLVENDPKNKELLKLGGEILYKLGRLEEARQYFNVALFIDENDVRSKERLAEIEEAISYLKPQTEPRKAKTTGEELLAKPQQEGAGMVKVVKPEKPEEKEVKPQEIPIVEEQASPKPPQATEKPEAKPVPKTEVKQPSAETAQISSSPQYIEALEEIKLGNMKKGIELLLNLASKLDRKDFRSAELLYSKILLFNPEDVKIAHKLANLYLENNEVSEAVFYLRVAAKHSRGSEKIKYLEELNKIIPQDTSTQKDLFDALVDEKRLEEAFEVLKSMPSADDVEEAAMKALPTARENMDFIKRACLLLSSKGIKSYTSQQYFYYYGKMLFASNDKPEAIKWFLAAHRISKLSLEDYVEIGKYLIDLPVDEEKDIVANAIYSYLETVENLEKKISLTNLILSLKPEKIPYIAKHLEINLALGKENELSKDIVQLARKNAFDFADLVYEGVQKAYKLMDVKDLVSAGEFFELAGKTDYADKIYKLVLEKDPKNEIAVIKSFIKGVEAESPAQILSFFERVTPSYSYISLLTPALEKLKEKTQRTPYDYRNYFMNGFLYFLTERYEEAIAAFQFVTRSKHHEPLMYLFLGISFDRIKLKDFAMKQFEIALSHPGITEEIRLEVLYRQALVARSMGDMATCKKSLKELSALKADYKNVQTLLAEVDETKIISIEKEEEK